MLLGNQSLSARKSLATGRDTRSCNGCSGGLGKRERIPFEHSDQKKSSVDESKEQRYSASFFPAMSGVEPPDRNDFSSSSDRRLPFGRNFTATPCNAPANSGYALDSAACSPDSNLSSSSLSESSKRRRAVAPWSPRSEDMKTDPEKKHREPSSESSAAVSAFDSTSTSEPTGFDDGLLVSRLTELDVLFLRHVRQVEIDLRPSASYLSTSTGNDRILPIMRGILVSWLTEVAMQFDLRQESLFLASSLLDRYLSKRPDTSRHVLQMVGTCCLMIAAKHEEVTYPSASQFVQIADNCFTLKQLLACEFQILETVGYRINTPLAANILRLYEAFLWPPIPEDGSVDSVMQKHVILLATYLVEVASVEYMMLQYLPSTLAAAALAVSSQALERPLARAEAAFIETLSAPGVQQAVNDLSALHVSAYNVALEEDGNPLVAIKEKYALPMWKSVSKVAPANPTAAASCSSE